MVTSPYFASLGGQSVREMVLTIPSSGRATADCWLDRPQGLMSGQQSLVLGGLTMLVTVWRGGEFAGVGSYRVVAGYGGWGNPIGPKPYTIPGKGGVRLSTVVKDAARACGERELVLADRSLGNYWFRVGNRPASRVFGQAAVKSWWIRNDGVTVVGDREQTVVQSSFDVLPGTDLGVGRVEIATDNPEDWSPGCVFTASTIATQKTVSAVVHTLTPERLRTTLWIV